MSNYPLGAENDSNAPFNKEELQGENVGLFDYILNECDLPYDVSEKIKKYEKEIIKAKSLLVSISDLYSDKPDLSSSLLKIQKQISEPQIFIEH